MSDFSLKAVFGMDTTGVSVGLKQLRRDVSAFADSWVSQTIGVTAMATLGKAAIDLGKQIRDTSDLEIPASDPSAETRSSTLRVETPCT